MARLYADENFSFPVVERLRLLGHDVHTVQEAGQANQRTPDHEILAFAVAGGRAVITFNRGDFKRLHRLSPRHSGIIVCTRDDDVAALSARIDQAIRAAGSFASQIIAVTKPP